jgi:hypothetical protein
MSVLGWIWPLLAGAASAWFLGARLAAHGRALRRAAQRAEAEGLLARHGAVLRRFLADPATPEVLQRLLLVYSDAMQEQDIVVRLARGAVAGHVTRMPDAIEYQDLAQAAQRLALARPDLAEDFARAMTTALLAALLRCTEAAAVTDAVLAAFATTPQRELTFAVTAARLRDQAALGFLPEMA